MTLEPIPHENEPDDPPAKVLAVEMSSQTSEPKKPAVGKQVHELNAFFEGIAETVKTFPKKIQIQLKRQVFNLVNDTEASLLDSENDNAAYYAMNSPAVGASDQTANIATDSSSGTSGSNECTPSPNPLQTSNPDQYCDIDIKTESMTSE